MNLADMIGDAEKAGKMSDQDFAAWWDALGTVVRIAAVAGLPPGERHEINNTSCSTERRWTADTGSRVSTGFGVPQA